jgi:hypothetical protein
MIFTSSQEDTHFINDPIINKEYYPRAVKDASIYRKLTKRIWRRNYSIITETYGFEKNSFEAETTPRAEAFWQFTDPDNAHRWLKTGVVYK